MALLSIGCAAVSLVATHRAFDPIARLRAALREATPTAIAHRAVQAERVAIRAQTRRRAWAIVPSPAESSLSIHAATFHSASRRRAVVTTHASRAQIFEVFRRTLDEGHFDDLPGRLQGLGLSSAEFQALCDDARRIGSARDWLQERLEPSAADEPPGFRLDPPIAGLARITRAEDGAVYGVDENERPLSITFLDLPPEALGELVRAVADGDATPDEPQAIVQSLSALRHRAGR